MINMETDRLVLGIPAEAAEALGFEEQNQQYLCDLCRDFGNAVIEAGYNPRQFALTMFAFLLTRIGKNGREIFLDLLQEEVEQDRQKSENSIYAKSGEMEEDEND